jgi:hypothetical protein
MPRISISPEYFSVSVKDEIPRLVDIETTPIRRLKMSGEYSVDYFRSSVRRWSKRLRGTWCNLPNRDTNRIQALLNTLRELQMSVDGFVKFVIMQTPKDRKVRHNIFNPQMVQLYAETIGYPEGVRIGSKTIPMETYLNAWKFILKKRLTSSTSQEVLKVVYGDEDENV